MTRPTYSSRNTATTILSTASYPFSNDHSTVPSTALTSPSLGSPPPKGTRQTGHLESMVEVYEGTMDPRYAEERNWDNGIIRGPSVKDRASRFERSSSSMENPYRKPSTISRPRSTSPLRINKTGSGSNTPPNTKPRRVPVPSTAPVHRTAQLYDEPRRVSLNKGQKRPSPELKRGSGTAKRMIQQWEGSTASPTAAPRRLPGAGSTPMSARVISRDYLDTKPLPIPRTNPIPASSPFQYSPTRTAGSPSRSTYHPSPLQHLQTPTQQNRKRSSTLTPSPSSYSLSPSPSGDKKKKNGGRSPLREIMGVFGGGIQAMGRKVKGKGKEVVKGRDSYGVREEDEWSSGMNRVGTNGLPGGIVYSDRMGDQEMSRAGSVNPEVIRSSAVMYLVPTPCSSLAPWGSWLSSYATLTPSHLRITYCPLFPNPQSGHSTPRRVFSGMSISTPLPPVAYSSIPQPSPGAVPDVELSMSDCVEVRSLRKEEVRGRGVPAVAEGVGTEVLEMVWGDGTKRYIGVEGVGGRLGWVSAIWDVLLACKSAQPQSLPPPSPVVPSKQLSQAPTSSLASFPYPSGTQARAELSDFKTRLANLEARSGSSAPPIQKFGDTWMAASEIGANDAPTPQRIVSGDKLRDSVQRMFDLGPDELPLGLQPAPTRRESEATVTDKVASWQPETERDLSIFSRTNSKRSQVSTGAIGVTYHPNVRNSFPATETTLSFDPNDLNPSRSASQVRRISTVLGSDDRRYGPKGLLPILQEADSALDAAPTHISRVDFPKPVVGGLTRIPSANSSIHTAETLLRTPHTGNSSTTTLSIADPTVIAKLDTHSNEHGTLSKQVDGVQIDLHRIITSLGILLQQSRNSTDPASSIPKVLDDKLNTLQLDVKGIENALNLSSLAANRQNSVAEEPKLPDVHLKLDSIARLCEDLLSRHGSVAPNTPPIDGLPIRASRVGDAISSAPATGSLGVVQESDEEKKAGEEVAQIMADLTGSSSKHSPRIGDLQVLHNVSAPSSPRPGSTITEQVNSQIGEVLTLVKELQGARTIQTQQTTDIARYLNELNTWLEKFVKNGTSELSTMNARLTNLFGDETAENPPGMPGLIVDVHSMMTEQKRRNDNEGMVGQRLDSLLKMMGEDKERQAAQMNTVDHVLSILERQRQENEVLLRALATDLTGEIRGERLRFVEAMQQATSVNVHLHVEEFKKLLSAEVNKSMQELGHMREEKKALEHQISDLFALKAKHGANSRDASRRPSAVPSPQPQQRVLPAPPGR